MVRRGAAHLQQLHPPPRVLRGSAHHAQELLHPHMVRAGAGHQRPSRRQHLHRAQVQLLVAAQRALRRPLRLGKRRRIEHDRVEPLARLRIIAQQLKGIRLDPIHLRGKPRIQLQVAVRDLQRSAARIHAGHPLAHPRQMQRKPALIGAHIERPPTRTLRRSRIVQPLIQKRPGLLPRARVEVEAHAR